MYIMTPDKAQEIINDYVKTHKDDSIAQPWSDLPCSPGSIKFAHFVLAEYLINNDSYTDELHRNLCNTFSEVNKFYFEDPEEIIKLHEEYNNDLKRGVIRNDPLKWVAERALENSIEFHNFVVDCQSKWKNSI